MANLELNTIVALNGVVQTSGLDNFGTASLSVTGTWVGTLTFEGSTDGTVFNTITALNSSSNLFVTTTTTNGQFLLNVAGLAAIRAKATAYTSGTITVEIKANAAAIISRPLSSLVGGTDGTIIGNLTDSLKTVGLSDGPVTAGAAATKSTLMGGIYNSSLPTLTTGQQVALQFDVNGRVITTSPLSSQTYTGTMSASNATVIANGAAFQSYTILITGTWSGAIVPEKSADGVTWVPVPSYDMAQGYVYASITSNNSVIVPGGTTFFRVRMSSYTSGTAVITIVGSQSLSVVEVIQPSGSSLNTVSKINDASGNPIYLGQATAAASLPVVLASNQTLPTESDRTGNTGISVLAGVAVATTNGCSSVLFNVTGTWSATLVIEGQDGQGNWVSVKGINVITGDSVSSITANAAIMIACGGYSQVRLRASVFTSGSVNVYFNAGSGTSYINQGVGGSLPDAWTVKPTDGTNSQGYTASSEAKVSVTQPLPAGNNNIGDVDVVSSALPTGAATSANQTTELASLASIDSKTPALVSGRQPVDGSGVTQPISAASLPLPTGAATSANQTTEITSLQLIDDVPTAMNGAFVKGTPIMGQLDDTSTTAATEDNNAPVRITAQRAVHSNLRNTAGTEVGTSGAPLRTDPTGTTSQPVVGNAASAAADSGNPIKIGAVYNSTLPTVTTGQRVDAQATPKGSIHVNLRDATGAEKLGQQTSANSIPVVLPSDQTITISALPATGSKFSFGQVTTSASTQVAVEATAYTEQTSNAQRSIASSSANDTSAGTGARTVKITYMNATGAGPFTETVTLNGTSFVNTVSTTICFVEKIEVVIVGSTGSNVGTLTLKAATAGGGATIGTITATNNQTFWAHHYVPTGLTSYISGVNIGDNGSSAGQGGVFVLKAATPATANTPEIQVSDFLNVPGAATSFTRIYNSPIQVVGPARVRAYITPSATSSYTSYASFDYIDN